MFINSKGIIEEISQKELQKIRKHVLQEIHRHIRDALHYGHKKRALLEKTHWWGTFADIDHFFSLYPKKEEKEALMQCLYMTWIRLWWFNNNVDLFCGDEQFDYGEFEEQLKEIAQMLVNETGWNPMLRYISKHDKNFVIY